MKPFEFIILWEDNTDPANPQVEIIHPTTLVVDKDEKTVFMKACRLIPAEKVDKAKVIVRPF